TIVSYRCPTASGPVWDSNLDIGDLYSAFFYTCAVPYPGQFPFACDPNLTGLEQSWITYSRGFCLNLPGTIPFRTYQITSPAGWDNVHVNVFNSSNLPPFGPPGDGTDDTDA